MSFARRSSVPLLAGVLGAGVDSCRYDLTLSTFLGGSGSEAIRDVAVDRQGNLYVAGGTESADFPVTPGAYQTAHNPGVPESPSVTRNDVFVAKLDPSGQEILWATLIGGPNHDRAYAIEVDDEGYVYVCGRAGRGFPVTSGAFQTAFRGHTIAPPPPAFYGEQDGFIAKLSPDGSRLLWSSYIGSNGHELCRDLAVDPQGDVHAVVPYRRGATPYPAAWFAGGFSPVPRGGQDLVVVKVRGDGGRVLHANYLGGSQDELAEASVRVDSRGVTHVLTATRSEDAPTTPGAHDRSANGGHDFYVVTLSTSGDELLWATYLGGSDEEMVETHNLALGADGSVIIAASTRSTDYPTTLLAYDRIYGSVGGADAGDAVISKLDAAGSLMASTFLGGSEAELAQGVATGPAGTVYAVGATSSPDFPSTVDAHQRTKEAGGDAFVVSLSADLSTLLHSTLLGGADMEALRSAAPDASGGLLAGGASRSADWPTVDPLQAQVEGSFDGIVVHLEPPAFFSAGGELVPP